AWEMQFAADPRWDDSELQALRGIAGSNLEAIDVSGLMMDPDSGQAASPTGATVSVTPVSPVLAASHSQQFNAKVFNSPLGLIWSMNPPVGTLSPTGLYTAPATVSAGQQVTIKAALSDGSASGSATVTLQPTPPPTLASVALASNSVSGGGNVNVTLTLT